MRNDYENEERMRPTRVRLSRITYKFSICFHRYTISESNVIYIVMEIDVKKCSMLKLIKEARCENYHEIKINKITDIENKLDESRIDHYVRLRIDRIR